MQRKQNIDCHIKDSSATTIDLVRNFRRLRALVIGDAMLDTYLEGEAERLCREGPVPVVHKTMERRIPGGAANTAANVHALEADVMFLSIVGRDLAGELLRKELRARGISDRWLIEDEGAATLHKLRILAGGQYVVRFDEGGYQEYEACQKQLLERLEKVYPLCDLVIVSDYRYGVISEALLERLKTLHTAEPKVMVIDSKALHRFRDIQATIVTPNYVEACALTGEKSGKEASKANDGPDGRRKMLEGVRRIARRLQDMLATEHIMITLGPDGIYLLNRQGKGTYLPAHPVEHANDVGAGDSFATALALALAAGANCEEAARIGIDAGSIAVTKRWTAVVHHQELLQRVSLREYARYALTPSPHSDKQGAWARLAALLEVERLIGHRIVFTNGSFDILHAGHVEFLRQAKALGDVLVVGINSDRRTRQLRGQGRPINSERDRMALVGALDMVDHVVLFDEDTPAELIRALRPHTHVKGGDYAYETLPEAEAVREVGGCVVILPLAGSVSTSSMIDRIVTMASQDEQPMSESREIRGGKR